MKQLKYWIAKRMHSWCVKILGIKEDLSHYTTTPDYAVAKFVKRYVLTDGETAFLLQRELGGLQFDIIIQDETSDQYKSVMEANNTSVEKIQEKYAAQMLEDIKKEIMPCVTLIPEVGMTGRVDYLIARYIAIQEKGDNRLKKLGN